MMPKDLSRLLASGLDLREEYEKASKTLESIGLSTYEARGYIALVAHGFGSAETIAPGQWDLVLEGVAAGQRLFLSKNRVLLN